MTVNKIGLGGGCHWCTEAVFASFVGIGNVQQGWINSTPPHDAFSEAVIVDYEEEATSLRDLIHIHLLTHAATSNHSMRAKYRSAIYYFTEKDKLEIELILQALQTEFDQPLITLVLRFKDFKPSLPEHINYYYSNPDKPFCQLYIDPKLQMLREKFKHVPRK